MIDRKTSIIIPSRNEPYTVKTINDLLNKASGDIEIIVVLDGWWMSSSDIVLDPKVNYIHFSKPIGMRGCINAGVAISKGEYILKTDAHCMFSQDYDEVLKQDCKDNWVVVPTRKRLDPDKWQVIKDGRPDINYLYLANPDDPSVWGGKGLQAKEWREKNLDKSLDDIKGSELMSAQGSCWFMKKRYFAFLELMDEENYGEFAKEMQEIGLKAWLSGGRLVRNKKCWYAHWHKPKSHGRGYSLSRNEWKRGTAYTNKWLDKVGVAWHKQTLPLSWLIKKFNPPGW